MTDAGNEIQIKRSSMGKIPSQEFNAEAPKENDLLDLIRMGKDDVNISIAQLSEFRMKLGIYEDRCVDEDCEKCGTPTFFYRGLELFT